MNALAQFPAAKVLADVESENALLGCLLKNSKTLDGLTAPLRVEYFYEPSNARVFQVISDIHRRGEVADISVVSRLLTGEAWFEAVNGRAHLEALRAYAAHPRALDTLVTVIRDFHLRRALVGASGDVATVAEDLDTPVDQAMTAAENMVSAVAKGSDFGDHWSYGEDLVNEVHYVTSADYAVDLIPTGLRAFDDAFGGIRPGKMTVFAARASMGKSTVALAIAAGIARAGYGVALFSLEMDKREIAIKLGCLEAYNPGTADHENPSPYFADRGELRPDQKKTLVEAIDTTRRWSLAVDDRAGVTCTQIKSAARRLLRQWDRAGIKPGVIIVDHLHVVRPEIPRGGNRVLELGDISGFLTDLAKETGVAVVAMCQLNRELENRGNKDKRPQLSDLRGSGKIEEDAYAVAFIYRPEYYLREPEDKNDHEAMAEYQEAMMTQGGKLHFIVSKNRSGPTGETVVSCSMRHSAVWG